MGSLNEETPSELRSLIGTQNCIQHPWPLGKWKITMLRFQPKPGNHREWTRVNGNPGNQLCIPGSQSAQGSIWTEGFALPPQCGKNHWKSLQSGGGFKGGLMAKYPSLASYFNLNSHHMFRSQLSGYKIYWTWQYAWITL